MRHVCVCMSRFGVISSIHSLRRALPLGKYDYQNMRHGFVVPLFLLLKQSKKKVCSRLEVRGWGGENVGAEHLSAA